MKKNSSKVICKIYIRTFLVLFFMGISINATIYYVAVDGNDSNTGLSESTAWKTIKYATNKVVAGDTVYVKAGTYHDKNLTLSGGDVQAPITFEGYKNIPGDVSNIDWWDYEVNKNLDPTKMPLLDGGNRAGAGTALKLASYTIVKNLQISNYTDGIATWSGDHYKMENIIITNIGDINDSYSGTGIGIYYGEGYNSVKNCVVYNAAAEGVMVYKNEYNLLENVKVYCDDETTVHANTDYYFEIESNNNIIRDCYIERVGNLAHVGHGFTMKGDGYEWSGNLFESCVAKNLEGGGFVVRHRGVKNNVFRNCTAYGATGFLIRDGASYNNFYNCKTIDCSAAIRLFDTDEDDGKQYAGRFNNFYNCLFTNSNYVIDFNSYSLNSDANDNRFINCVFDGGNSLFNSRRTNYDNKMINCIVTNVINYKSGGSIDFDFISTDFWNNGFDTPSGVNILSVDPLFVDAANSDYNLTQNSPMIDAGTTDTTGLNLPYFDVSNNYRFADGNGDGSVVIDLGIYEYNSYPVSVEPEVNNPQKFVLSQNYPNPFNPSTVIEFTIPTTQLVNLSIYNILGEKVAELVNGTEVAGNHSVSFNASALTSGVYFYRIVVNNFIQTRKMILLK